MIRQKEAARLQASRSMTGFLWFKGFRSRLRRNGRALRTTETLICNLIQGLESFYTFRVMNSWFSAIVLSVVCSHV